MPRMPRRGMDVASCLFILLLIAPAVYAAEYTVGDSSGWVLAADYGAWIAGKTFYVGDNLLFQYGPTHSVDIVSLSDYTNCTKGSPLRSYKSGNDTITLTSTGTMYFICPTTYHCFQGMKVAVTVLAGNSTSTTPTTPSSSAPSSSSSSTTNSRVAGNLCNINALVLGLGVSLVYALMG